MRGVTSRVRIALAPILRDSVAKPAIFQVQQMSAAFWPLFYAVAWLAFPALSVKNGGTRPRFYATAWLKPHIGSKGAVTLGRIAINQLLPGDPEAEKQLG